METGSFWGLKGVRINTIINIRRLMIAGWLIYYLTWSTWSKEAFAEFVLGLGRNPLWKIIFLFFLVILTLEVLYRFTRWWKKSRILAIAWLILPAGALLFLLGFFLSANFRMDTRILTGKGDIFTLPWDERRFAVMDVRSGIKERFLDIEQESPSPIFTREPVVLLTDFERAYRIGAFPPVRIHGNFFHILNSNMAPSIEVRDSRGNVVLQGELALQILPAGNTDYALLGDLPYRLSMKLLPSGEIKRGDLVAKEYNLEDRLYEIRISKIRSPEEAGVTIAEGESRGPLRFDEYTLTVTGHTYWVLLEVVRDDAVYIIGAGLILLMVGIFTRLLMTPWWLREIRRPD